MAMYDEEPNDLLELYASDAYTRLRITHPELEITLNGDEARTYPYGAWVSWTDGPTVRELREELEMDGFEARWLSMVLVRKISPGVAAELACRLRRVPSISELGDADANWRPTSPTAETLAVLLSDRVNAEAAHVREMYDAISVTWAMAVALGKQE